MAVLAVHGEQLADDVEDRAGRDGEEDDADGVARPGLADDRAEERRGAADEAEEREQLPARADPLPRQRTADAEPLGRVVQAEADDERDREADLARGGGLADGEALTEVVHADTDGD